MNNIQQARPEYIPNWNARLRGHDLWSKSGFQDGDILDEMLWCDPVLEAFDNSLYDLDKRITYFKDMALIALAELFLLPKFDRSLTLYHANFLHNPCRVEEAEWWPLDQMDFELPEVEIEGITVSTMLYSLKAVFEAALADKSVAFPSYLQQTALIFSALMEYPVAICDNNLENIVCLPNPLSTSASRPC